MILRSNCGLKPLYLLHVIVIVLVLLNCCDSLKLPTNFKLNRSFPSFDILKDNPLKKSFQKLDFIVTSKLKEDSAVVETDQKIKLEDVLIREATLHDIPAVVNLRINVFYPNQKADSSFHSQIFEKIRRRIQEQGSICLTVQLDNNYDFSRKYLYGNTIGTVEFCPSDFTGTAYEHIGSPRKIYVADLAIREDARRIGLATKMIQTIENYCKKEFYEEIYLHVDIDNFIARKLYHKLGFVELSQHDQNVISFTESRLQKAASGFIFLRKVLIDHVDSIQRSLVICHASQADSLQQPQQQHHHHDQGQSYSYSI